MMNISKYIYNLLSLLLIVCIAGCSDDRNILPDNPSLDDTKSQYYITLMVSTPNQALTRSATDSEGGSGSTIEGTNPECEINSATIYFALNNIIQFSFNSEFVEKLDGTSSSGKTHEVRFKIDEDIEKFADLAGNENVQVFIVANTASGDNNLYSPTGLRNGDNIKDAKFPITSVDANVIGLFGNNGHTMPLINAELFTVDFKTGITGSNSKEKLKSIKEKFFTTHTATTDWWEISNVLKLERGVARFEFKDIDRNNFESGGTKDNSALDPFTYWIGDSDVKIELYSMKPFNVNKNSYLFRHVAPGDFTAANSVEDLLGKENGYTSGSVYNWISNPDWTLSSGVYTKTPQFWNKLDIDDDLTAYSIGESGGSSDCTVYIEDIASVVSNLNRDVYLPWCYVSENTLPSINLMDDYQEETDETSGEVTKLPVISKYATGVYFTFKILDEDGNPLQYSEDKEKYPDEITNSTTTPGAIVITMENSKWVEVSPIKDREGNDIFVLNYIACIKHNNEGSKAEGKSFAPMHYGVVRNNTYQMRITQVEFIPLPNEPKTMWLTLEVNVLKWNVRKDDDITLF